jgi:hypothetical protein
MKQMPIVLTALIAGAVMMTACGRNRNDADTNSVQRTETQAAQTTEDSGLLSDAQDMVTDVVSGAEDFASDVLDEGRDVVSDITGTETTEAAQDAATDTSR